MFLSDFRFAGDAEGGEPISTSLARLAKRHDLVCGILHDPREEHLPRAGLIRVTDPEAPERSLLLNSNARKVRAAYRRSWALRASTLEHTLRTTGGDVLWLRTDRDPLQTLMHFFHSRAARLRTAA